MEEPHPARGDAPCARFVPECLQDRGDDAGKPVQVGPPQRSTPTIRLR